MKWATLVLSFLNFGFMLTDGMKALIGGDYFRPSSGEHAGKLGPWANVVKMIGIDPESMLMKIIFVVWGIAGLALAVLFVSQPAAYGKWLLIFSICSLWYLVPGTVISAIMIILISIILSKS